MKPEISITLEAEIRAVVEVAPAFESVIEQELQLRLRAAGPLRDGIKIEPRDLDEFASDDTIEGAARTFFRELHERLPFGVSRLIFFPAR